MDDKLPTLRLSPDRAGMAQAAEILRQGGLVAIPTETVYGLAGRADSAEAVARIFAAKGRPGFNPLIVHVASLAQAEAFTDLERRVAGGQRALPGAALASQPLRDYAACAWQVPVTLVVPLRPGAPLAPAVSAGLPTVALRMPAHPVALALIEAVGPLAAPSANRSGFTSPTTADHVLATLAGRIDAVLDAGPTQAGLESTILKLEDHGGWRQLRPGPALLPPAFPPPAFPPPAFPPPAWPGHEETPGAPPRIEAPGQLSRHYSPGKPVRLEALVAEPDEFLIGFGPVAGDASLSPAGDVVEAARNLYALLHLGAKASAPRIAVAPVPRLGIGAAINDRLQRAARS